MQDTCGLEKNEIGPDNNRLLVHPPKDHKEHLDYPYLLHIEIIELFELFAGSR